VGRWIVAATEPDAAMKPLARRERQVTAQNHEARVKDTCRGQTWDIPGSDAIHLRVMWP
jgi:hypothetical protein